jgi:hypothetical protein
VPLHLLLCPWFIGLTFNGVSEILYSSFHTFLFLPYHCLECSNSSTVSSSHDSLSSPWFSLLGRLSTEVFFLTYWAFYLQNFDLIFFPSISTSLLSYFSHILHCLLYFVQLFNYILLEFIQAFIHVLFNFVDQSNNHSFELFAEISSTSLSLESVMELWVLEESCCLVFSCFLCFSFLLLLVGFTYLGPSHWHPTSILHLSLSFWVCPAITLGSSKGRTDW